MSIKKHKNVGNGKRHRNPPLGLKKLVCFGERTWIRLEEVVKKPRLQREQYCSEAALPLAVFHRKEKSGTRRKKEKAAGNDRANKRSPGREIKVVDFSLDGIRVRKWWEKENWAMVTDPENPFGDLTREQKLRVTELLKGRGIKVLENASRAKLEALLKQKSGHMGLKG